MLLDVEGFELYEVSLIAVVLGGGPWRRWIQGKLHCTA